ncbi:TPA: hypothetical protein N0F65_004418, partial [Lagenidium giganteum]
RTQCAVSIPCASGIFKSKAKLSSSPKAHHNRRRRCNSSVLANDAKVIAKLDEYKRWLTVTHTTLIVSLKVQAGDSVVFASPHSAACGDTDGSSAPEHGFTTATERQHLQHTKTLPKVVKSWVRSSRSTTRRTSTIWTKCRSSGSAFQRAPLTTDISLSG